MLNGKRCQIKLGNTGNTVYSLRLFKLVMSNFIMPITPYTLQDKRISMFARPIKRET